MPDLESDRSTLFWENPWFQTRMFPVGHSFHKSEEENLALLSDLMPDVPWDEIPQRYRLELWRDDYQGIRPKGYLLLQSDLLANHEGKIHALQSGA